MSSIVELTPADVAAYTGGRLSATDSETQRMLNAALAALRQYCGWHVTPVISDTMTIDGNGLTDITIPTLQIASLTSVTVGGTALDLATVDQSNEAPGVLHLNNWTFWTEGVGNVTIELSHGFDDAYDWQAAVLELVDRMSGQIGEVAGNSGPMIAKKIDDVEYRWADRTIGTTSRLFAALDHSLIDHYRLLPIA